MSQITQHILDPYNVPVLTALEQYALESSIANELNALSLYDAFGFGECGSWDISLKRYLILDMFNCTACNYIKSNATPMFSWSSI